MPRSNFVHKKSQENFERVTLRRLIQIQDGDADVVGLWLAFIQKHAYYGVGMKANVYEHEKLGIIVHALLLVESTAKHTSVSGVGKTMDVSLENIRQSLECKWAHFGRKKSSDTSEKVMEMLSSAKFRHTADAALSRVGNV